MPASQERYERWRLTAVMVWAAIGALLLIVAALWALGRISGALVPFVIAFVLVFLLNSPVRQLSRRGVPRGVSAALAILVAILVLGGVFTLVGPHVGRQLGSLANSAPQIFQRVDTAVTALEDRYADMAFPQWVGSVVTAATARLSEGAVTFGNDAARVLVSAGSGVATGIVDFVLAIVIAFWALRDLPKMRAEVISLAGPRFEEDAEHLIRTVTRVVGGYLRGQTILSLTTGTLSGIGLTLVGVPYAIVIGALAVVFNYVPYVGPFMVAVIAGLVGLFKGTWTAVLAVAVVTIAQNFTDTVVGPRVMSEQVDLHPTLVIFSLLVGGSLFGIPGMLFAIPVAATGKGLFVYYFEQRTQRQLSSENGALFRGAASGPEYQQDERDDDEGIP